MMPLIAAWQNTQLADLFSGLLQVYKKMREFLTIPRAWLGLEFNMMHLISGTKPNN